MQPVLEPQFPEVTIDTLGPRPARHVSLVEMPDNPGTVLLWMFPGQGETGNGLSAILDLPQQRQLRDALNASITYFEAAAAPAETG